MSLDEYEPSARLETQSIDTHSPSGVEKDTKVSKIDRVSEWLYIASMLLKAYREIKGPSKN